MSDRLAHERLMSGDLPRPVLEAVLDMCGAIRKVEFLDGARPGLAAHVYAERDDIFVKAVPLNNPALVLYQREGRVARHLKEASAPAPLLLWQVDTAGWRILAWELINDHAHHARLGRARQT
jgi:hypothetical protein